MQQEDFRARLDAELDEAPGPPLGTLVAAATSDGERRRRRRTVVQFATGTAGVATVVLGAVLVAQDFGPDSRAAAASPGGGAHAVAAATTPGPATSTSTPTTTPAPTPTTTPTPSTTTTTPWPVTSTSGTLPTAYDSSEISGLPKVPPGQARTTAQAMILLLEQDLGKTGIPGEAGHTFGYAPDGSPGQTQKTMFMADLYWNRSTVSVRYTLPPKNPPHVKPGGDVFRWDTPGISGTSEVKLAKGERGVEVTRPDGSKVMVLEVNGRENGNYGPDRPDLPLTSDQLLAIAQDARWGATMSQDFVDQAAAEIQVEASPW
jgi:hypothetical protein